MKRTTTLPLLLGLLMACEPLEVPQPQPETCSPDAYATHPYHQTYQHELEQYRRKSGAPGSLLLIQKTGQPRWIGAVGQSNLTHQTALRGCDPFRTGSITKLFVAVAVLKLRDRSQLRLDDRLATLLPHTAGRIPQADRITVRHLLNHTSGIVDPPNESLRYRLAIVDDHQARFRLTPEQQLERYVYGKPLIFSPGTRWKYSNTGFLLLGQLIERKTGKRLQEVLEEEIFRPLQLRNTYLDARDDRNVVRGYLDLYGNGRLFDVSPWDRADNDGEADGGLVSTATDLATFMAGLFAGKLLPEATLAELIQTTALPTCPNGDCEYGLGIEHWKTELGTAYGHNGTSAGFEVNLLYFPHNQGVFLIFKNTGNGSDKSFLNRVMQ